MPAVTVPSSPSGEPTASTGSPTRSAIQTDAAINPGNSGGRFAIPVDRMTTIVEDLLD